MGTELLLPPLSEHPKVVAARETVTTVLGQHYDAEKRLGDNGTLPWLHKDGTPVRFFEIFDLVHGPGWHTVDLVERLMRMVLYAEGWDLDLAVELLERRTPGSPDSDVMAEIDRLIEFSKGLPAGTSVEDLLAIDKRGRS